MIRAKDLLSRRYSGAAAIVFAARLVAAVATMGAFLILSRTLSPSSVGTVAAVQSAAAIAGIVGMLNLDGLAIRLLPGAREIPGQLRQYRQVFASTALIGLPLSTILVAIYLNSTTSLPSAGMNGLAAVILLTLMAATFRIGSMMSHGAGHVIASGICSTARAALFLLSCLLLAVIGALSLNAALWGACLAMAAAAILQITYLRYRTGVFSRDEGPVAPHRWRWDAIALMPTVFLLDLFADTVTMLASAAVTSPQLAILTIALRVSLFVRMLPGAIQMSVAPSVSKVFAEGRKDDALDLLGKMTFAACLIAGAAAFGVAIVANPIMGLFGEAYREGAMALRVLGMAPLMLAITGPGLLVLTLKGQSRDILRDTIMGGVALIAGVVIGRHWGPTGVALGVTLSQLVWAVLLSRSAAQLMGQRIDLAAILIPSARQKTS